MLHEKELSAGPTLPRRQVLEVCDLVVDYSKSQRDSPRTPGSYTLSGVPPEGFHTLALNHVNFTLSPGQSVAVMGPSGSGKSTLLHALAGIIKPTSGRVIFQGKDLTAMGDGDRTKLRRSAFGFVFQSGQLLPELPAMENIALPLMLGGMAYHHATDAATLWLERLGLRQLASSRPGEMSGGQMQRICIARALCVNPTVVFADEPTGALDQHTGREVMGILMQAARANGSSVVVVTHDPTVAGFCANTVYMRDGQLYRTPEHSSRGAMAYQEVRGTSFLRDDVGQPSSDVLASGDLRASAAVGHRSRDKDMSGGGLR